MPQRAKHLLENGTDPNIKDDATGATPLMKTGIVMGKYSLEVAKILLAHGADINLTDMAALL